MNAAPRRVLVTGASGRVGGRLAALLAARHHVVCARHHGEGPPGLPTVAFDLASPAAIEGALEAARPDAVVHSAAFANADECERRPDEARRLNAQATAVLARAARRRGIALVALSTDLVLAGDRAFSDEDVAARPGLVYGRTKLAGEEAVLAEGGTVARLPLMVGRGHGPGLTSSEAIADALRAGRRLRLFTDQYRTPVDPGSVAEAIERILGAGLAGRFHLGGDERLSRHELGLRVARVLGLDPAPIEPVAQAETPFGAARPADCSLDSARARRALAWAPRPLDEAIRDGRSGPS